MIRLFSSLLVLSAAFVLSAKAEDEARSATVNGVGISARVSDPATDSAALRDDRDLLAEAKNAPAASAVYRPPQTAEEAGRLNIPSR